MVDLVKAYLLQNSSVSIPGLGTIYVERIPAQSDFVNRQLLPPAYHYRFDRYFDAPGRDFFTYLSARQRIPDYEAIKQYNEWSVGLRSNIIAESPVVLEGIGSLSRDEAGDVVFAPEAPLKTYDIPVSAQRIIRTNARHAMLVGDKETTTADMNSYLQVEAVHKERASWWIYALILAAIALTAIFFHYYKSGSSSPFGNGQTIEAR